jgi:RNA polymerase sigma-70 factor (ECF subfamily)
MAAGPEHGLALIDRLDGLDDYYLLHSARADLLRRLGRHSEAASAYAQALARATNPTERAFLQRRLGELKAVGKSPETEAAAEPPGA